MKLSRNELDDVRRGIDLLSEKIYKASTISDIEKCLEILRALRAVGCDDTFYIEQIMLEHALRKMEEIFVEANPKAKTEGVYAILFSEGHVKIGRTTNYASRKNQLSLQSAGKILDDRFFPCQRSSTVEAQAHRNFSAYRIKNEFFDVSFESACDFLRACTEIAGPYDTVN